MNDNPFQSPSANTEVVGVPSGKRNDLRHIAIYQKGILVCIVIYLIALLGQVAFPDVLRLIVGVSILVIGLVGAVFVLLLVAKVYSMPVGILLGILTLLPLIGLVVLFMVNHKATSLLRRNGISVGLLGAELSEI